MPTHYKLTCVSVGACVRVLVNDVPRVTWEQARERHEVDLLDPWLVADTEIRILLAWPSSWDIDPEDSQVSVVIDELTGPKEPFDVAPVARFDWPPSDIAQRERLMPSAQRRRRHESLLRLRPAIPPPSKLWSAANKIDLTPELRDRALELALECQLALEMYAFDRVMELMEFRLNDLALAYQVSIERMKAELATLLFLSLPEEAVAALEAQAPVDLTNQTTSNVARLVAEDLENSLEVHLVGERRLLWITRPDFEPALRTPSAPAGAFHVYIAQMGDKLTLVR